MPTSNKDLNLPAYDDPNWDVPLNENFDWIDAALGDTTSISVAGVPVTPVVLTVTQYQSASLSFTGLLGNNVTYQIPSGVGGFWFVFNGTTGSFTLTIDNVAVGTSVIIPQGQSRIIVSDGTNIKVAGNYGSTNQVLYNDGNGPTGDADFTFASDVLSVPRVNTTTGTAVAPALRAANDTDTGIFFPAVNQIALSTSATQRILLNATGSMAVGAAADYGTAGEVLKSAGNAAEIAWGLAGAVAIANQAASGTSVTFSGLDLSLYKFVVVVVDNVSHGAGSNRQLQFGVDAVSAATSSGASFNGMIILHPLSAVAFTAMGQISGGNSYATGMNTSYNSSATSLVMSLSGPGSFTGGNFYLLGIA